jgi:hypothetical protein
MSDQSANWIQGYLSFLQKFVSGSMSASQFEKSFMKFFKNDTAQVPCDEFDILDSLFAAVDDYVPAPDLRRRAGRIDDQQLREQAALPLTRLSAR